MGSLRVPATTSAAAATAGKATGVVLNAFSTGVYDDLVALGVDAVRVETWGGAINTGGAPTMAQLYPELAKRGIKVLPLVNPNGYNVAWSSTTWEAEAVRAAQWADLGVVEIANEPYGAYFWGAQARTPGTYAAMVVRCATALAASGYPKVKALAAAGGTGSSGLDYDTTGSGPWSQDTSGGGWINDMVAGAPTLLSVIGGIVLHPYGLTATTDSSLDGQGQLLLLGAENRVQALGFPQLPLWVTECGRKCATDVTRGETSSTAIQAEEARKLLDENLYNPNRNLRGVFWFSYRDWAAFDANGDNGWGLRDENNATRTVYTALQAAARKKGSAGVNRPLLLRATVAAASFDVNMAHRASVYVKVKQTGNGTFTASNAQAGQRLTFEFIQDATGGRTITFGADFKKFWTPSTTASKTNVIDFIRDAANANWLQVGATVGL